MFYATSLIKRRSSFAKVWIAATLGTERLPRSFLIRVSIARICRELLETIHINALSLRLEALLLVGIARIYERQVLLFCTLAEDWFSRERLQARVCILSTDGRQHDDSAAAGAEVASDASVATDANAADAHQFAARNSRDTRYLLHRIGASRRKQLCARYGSITWGPDSRSLEPVPEQTNAPHTSGEYFAHFDVLWHLYDSELYGRNERAALLAAPQHGLVATAAAAMQPYELAASVPEAAAEPSGSVERAWPLSPTPFRVNDQDTITLRQPRIEFSSGSLSIIPQLDERERFPEDRDASGDSSIAPRRLLEALDAAALALIPADTSAQTNMAPLPNHGNETTTGHAQDAPQRLVPNSVPTKEQQERLGSQRSLRRRNALSSVACLQLDELDALALPPRRLQMNMHHTRDLVLACQQSNRSTNSATAAQGPYHQSPGTEAGSAPTQLQRLAQSLDENTYVSNLLATKDFVYRCLSQGIFAVAVARTSRLRAIFEAVLRPHFEAQLQRPATDPKDMHGMPHAGEERHPPPESEDNAQLRASLPQSASFSGSAPERLRGYATADGFEVPSLDTDTPGAYAVALRAASSEHSASLPRMTVPDLRLSGVPAARSPLDSGDQCSPGLAMSRIHTELMPVMENAGQGTSHASIVSIEGDRRPTVTPQSYRETLIRCIERQRAGDASSPGSCRWVNFSALLGAFVSAFDAKNDTPSAQGTENQTKPYPAAWSRPCAALLFATTLKLATTGQVTAHQTTPYGSIALHWNGDKDPGTAPIAAS